MLTVPDVLALNGGTPVRRTMLPYGRQSISEEDIEAVVAILRSDWLTTGPAVGEFERGLEEVTGASHAVAVSNGTAALHAAMFALGIGPGDEVIVPAITFAATANCIVYQGATPIFADVSPDTLLLDLGDLEARITPATRAIIPVDYAGQPCQYDALRDLATRHNLALVADGCHALGAEDAGRRVGSLADLTTFSFHPVKHITTGEGGAITTTNADLAERCRRFRNHGIATDHRQRERKGTFYYEMVELGYNYRLTDFQCALGLRQLKVLPGFLERRRAIAARYDAAFARIARVRPLAKRAGASHAYHLYVVRFDLERLSASRNELFAALRAEGIGVNVHYLPVHLHPFYRQRFGLGPGLCPAAEAAYEAILTLPLFPAMTDGDADDVVTAVEKVIRYYER